MARQDKYDLVIVGGGPAGLSAAINAESESIDTLVVDAATQFGGQAGTSSLIENYPGFPGGVSGRQLTGLMVDQALRFNTEFLAPWRVERVDPTPEGVVVSDGIESVIGRAVLISSGVEYRHLVVPNLAAYLGRGVTYGSPNLNEEFKDKKIYVVGGANSAGQAAMHLSSFNGCNIHLLVRGKSIEDRMSSYLSERILAKGNIQVHTDTEVVGVDGDGYLNEIILKTGSKERNVPADELFVLIGAAPKTFWVPDHIARDDLGFIKAGGDITEATRAEFIEEYGRQPFPHETSVPGLFVAGDVRCGTTKRVATAAGDGANTVPDLHRYLATLK